MMLRGFLEHVLAANDIEPNLATWDRLQHVLPRDTVATVSHAALPSADVPMIMAELAAARVRPQRSRERSGSVF
jgi:hypothetical protein